MIRIFDRSDPQTRGACYPLQQSKHITCGDGGIVASNDERFGPLLQQFGDKGIDRLSSGGMFEVLATNYRMSEPQAAIAAAQLDRLESIAESILKTGIRIVINERMTESYIESVAQAIIKVANHYRSA